MSILKSNCLFLIRSAALYLKTKKENETENICIVGDVQQDIRLQAKSGRTTGYKNGMR